MQLCAKRWESIRRNKGRGAGVPQLFFVVLLLAFRTVLLLLFIAYIIKRDLPLSQIPVINRIIKKK